MNIDNMPDPVAWMMENLTHFGTGSRSLHWTPQTNWHITWETVPLYTDAQLRAAIAAQAEAHAAELSAERDKVTKLSVSLHHVVAGLEAAEEERDALRAEVEELRADAERMRWIAAHCWSDARIGTGTRWLIVVEGPPPVRPDDEDAFYEALDAAMGKI